ncbi:MAG: N-acetylglucosamine malate deacetylase 1 [Candidatus Woesearchaeota archaeon]|nr:N-acetylglucosamine malate deacetylase 1 [Candidatus Woesearchaeota archaeon]MDN5327719.1 N-acetylglucosamine malate deacetylase 1 [Candidatus Woesearchaeota archaeon]
MKVKKKSILVIVAHSDDQILGCGGTIAEYSSRGYEINTIIFSFGEKGNPWFKKKVTSKMRILESKRANEIVKGNEIRFFGLEEGKFAEGENKEKAKKMLKTFIKRYKPARIFTHSPDDIHKDHKDVCNLTLEIAKEINYPGEIYCFDVWNPFDLKKHKHSKLYINIDKVINLKIKALKEFKSQKLAIYLLFLPTLLKNLISGLKTKGFFAEVFYKIY